jgi:hypothetical protein
LLKYWSQVLSRPSFNEWKEGIHLLRDGWICGSFSVAYWNPGRIIPNLAILIYETETYLSKIDLLIDSFG